jgi:hypothetical protein
MERLRRALHRLGMRCALALLIAIQGWLWLSHEQKTVDFPLPPPPPASR